MTCGKSWFEKCRLMMADWAKFLAKAEVMGEVIDMQSARALTAASVRS